MKKRVIALTLILLLLLSSCVGGASYSTAANLDPIPGRDFLYYDPVEGIVYIIYHEYVGNQGYGYMSPYYASNGLPYRYDVKTQTLVEIGD